MATPYRDEGIVLRRVDYAEADRIFTLFTREHGKVGAIVRGARRPRSHLGPVLDLFARCAFQLAPGRGELVVVTQAERLSRPWPGDDLTRTACAAVVAAVADAIQEGLPIPPLYALVGSTLAATSDPAGDARAELAWFALQGADVLGYRPAVDRCAGCDGPLVDGDAAFAADRGGVLQGRCADLHRATLPCHAATLRLLRRMTAGERDLFDRVRWTPSLRDELEALLLAHLAHHLDRPLRAVSLLSALRGAG
ncbi:MAG TPA: DNA repair protein RecO [Candidatus Micrarchaeia archaeon]|nr:DNA repair protein RecO [Candidatus Micrarchaeia archaeon]